MDFCRRGFLAQAGVLFAQSSPATVVVDPTLRFEISRTLYMQFMEPLGVTDSSVEAAWDYERDDWRSDFVATTADLRPGMMRWGGNYSRYYKWREGVGPVKARPSHINYDWGGKETNRVGTHEFVDYCRRVKAEPMYCVNFLGDGHAKFRATPHEGNRTGDAREAAEWVSYCNDPDDKLRRSHGHSQPYGVNWWQIGNETSYGTGGFPLDEACTHTVEFARAMRARDPKLKLIGWGDRGREGLWARTMVERAGEHVDLIAMHMMGQSPVRKETVLRGLAYQYDPAQAWAEMLELADRAAKRLAEFESAVPKHDLAITEGHLSLRPHNANPVLLEWLSAAYHARCMNTYQRHGGRVKIATLADFCGNRWTVNALMLQVPRGGAWLTPAGVIMRLFGRHCGTHGVSAISALSSLDIAASRSGDRVFLHVLNTDYRSSVAASFEVTGRRVVSGVVHQIAPENPREYVSNEQPNVFQPVTRTVEGVWRFPARSVSVVELLTS
jgi:alpha-N-arabinofuranosidase